MYMYMHLHTHMCIYVYMYIYIYIYICRECNFKHIGNKLQDVWIIHLRVIPEMSLWSGVADRP